MYPRSTTHLYRGGVSENQIFIDGIKTAVKRFYQSLPIPFPQPEIVKCKYCNDANMVGAYLHYLRKTMRDKLSSFNYFYIE